MSKIAYLPHVNVVVAGRGTAACLALVSMHLHGTQFFASHSPGFDEVATIMPEILTMAYRDAYAMQNSIPVITPIPEIQELVLVGWSKRAGVMRANVYKKGGRNAEVQVTEITEHQNYSVPWDAKWGDMPGAASGDSVEEMAELAQIQTWNQKKDFPIPGIGGRLMIAELTREQLTMRTQCELSASPAGEERSIVISPQDLQRMAAAV